MVRAVFAVIAGAIAWLAVFFLLAGVLSAVWPAYLEHARIWQSEFRFTFTTPMACFNLLFWLLADVFAGWVAMKMARRALPVRVLAGIIAVYVAVLHIVLYWSTFPWWYNLGVVIPAIPAILLGGRLAQTRAQTGSVAA